MKLSDLIDAGFDVQEENHAVAVLTEDFPDPLSELCDTLLEIKIADVELIRSGGGEANSTQRLRVSLAERNWIKENIVIRKIVDGQEKTAITHEIDHIRRAVNGVIALEIEWNNKDPFFDRDLENFQRLHSEGAISVGVIITRGYTLQKSLVEIITSCAIRHEIRNFDDLKIFGLAPTVRQRKMVKEPKVVKGGDKLFVEDWARHFVQDKFGSSTTHWAKLQDRISRGVGNPCPLLLIGIPSNVIYEKDLQ